MVAGIYASCMIHNVDITIAQISEHMEFKGKRISKFCQWFYRKVELTVTESSHKTPHRTELIEFRDLERNGVIPGGSAEQFHLHYSALYDIFVETDLHGAMCKHAGVMLGVMVSMVLQFTTGQGLKQDMLGHFNINSERDLHRFNKSLSTCWRDLTRICHGYMVWIVPSKNQLKCTALVAQRLDKFLANKDNIVQYLRKKRSSDPAAAGKLQAHPDTPENGLPSDDVTSERFETAGRLKTEHPKPEPEVSTNNQNNLDGFVNEGVFTQCTSVLEKYIAPQCRRNVLLYFRRLLELLYYTELHGKLLRLPVPFYFALLYQIVLSQNESNIPDLSAFHKQGDEKTLQADTLIRLTFIRLFLVHQNYLLPTNVDKPTLVSRIHTFYYTICGSLSVFRPFRKRVADEFVFMKIFNSATSSPRSDLSDSISTLSDISETLSDLSALSTMPVFAFMSDISDMSNMSNLSEMSDRSDTLPEMPSGSVDITTDSDRSNYSQLNPTTSSNYTPLLNPTTSTSRVTVSRDTSFLFPNL